MAIYGADIEALEALANQLHVHKETTATLIHQVLGEIESLLWEGPDAESLRPEWTDRMLRLATIVDDTLAGVAAQAEHQAVEQREASEL